MCVVQASVCVRIIKTPLRIHVHSSHIAYVPVSVPFSVCVCVCACGVLPVRVLMMPRQVLKSFELQHRPQNGNGNGSCLPRSRSDRVCWLRVMKRSKAITI